MVRNATILVIILWACGSAGAAPTVVYENDFGTAAQYDELDWQIARGSFDLEDPGPDPPGDLDSDGLYRTVKAATSWSAATGYRFVNAPLFQTLSDITVRGYGRGSRSGHNSGASWTITGGSTEYTVQTDSSNVWKQYSISSGSDPCYTNVNGVMTSTYVDYGSGGAYNDAYTGRTAAFQVEAEVNDGQVGDRVLISDNDWGTPAQRAEWSTGETYPDTFTDIGTLGDTGNDNLSCRVEHVFNSGNDFTHTYTLEVSAPAGWLFKDPIVTGQGYFCASYYGCYAQIHLSANGTDWVAWSNIPSDSAGGPA